MKISAIGKSDKDLKRKINEDRFIVDVEVNLFVVADGMGGHKAGEVASQMGAALFCDFFKEVTGYEK